MEPHPETIIVDESEVPAHLRDVIPTHRTVRIHASPCAGSNGLLEADRADSAACSSPLSDLWCFWGPF